MWRHEDDLLLVLGVGVVVQAHEVLFLVLLLVAELVVFEVFCLDVAGDVRLTVAQHNDQLLLVSDGWVADRDAGEVGSDLDGKQRILLSRAQGIKLGEAVD